MIYLISITLGVISGLLSRGRLSNILKLKIKKQWLVIIAFVVQFSAQLLGFHGFGFVAEYSFIIQGTVFALLVAGFWANREYLGVCTAGLGFLLNAAVMMANGGKMPVDPGTLEKADMMQYITALQNGIDGKHIIADASTRLLYLADIIHPPAFLGRMTQIVSLGDIIFALGMAIFLYEIISGKCIGIRTSGKRHYYFKIFKR